MKRFLILMLLVAMQSRAMDEGSPPPFFQDTVQQVENAQNAIGEDVQAQFVARHRETLKTLNRYYFDDEERSKKEIEALANAYREEVAQPYIDAMLDSTLASANPDETCRRLREISNERKQAISKEMVRSMVAVLKASSRVNSLAYKIYLAEKAKNRRNQ